MRRILTTVSALAICTPAFGQGIDSQGAAQVQKDISRYFGSQAFEKGVIKVEPKGDAYQLTIDFKALVNAFPKQDFVKFDVPAYVLAVKPRTDGSWDVSSVLPAKGTFEVKTPEGQQNTEIEIKDGKFSGLYDPALAAFTAVTSSMAGMTMTSKDPKSNVQASAGATTMTGTGAKAADGGVDFTMSQTVADFSETVTIDDPESGMRVPLTFHSPSFAVDATAKGLRSRAILDLVAFGVANQEEAKVKANQAELKTLLLAALPVWQRFDGAYNFRDFKVGTPLGEFGMTEMVAKFGADGVSQNGKLSYGLKASGLTVPAIAAQMLPAWSVSLLPTDIELNFGGSNLDLDTMARKAIDTFDLTKEPPLPEDFGDKIGAEFLAKSPKVLIEPSIIKNKDTEIAFNGEVRFPFDKPDPTKKPDMDLTITVSGYDKIVEKLQEAAKTTPDASNAVAAALAMKGFAKTLPDGRIEWALNAKPDGTVVVNGVTVKAADPVVDPSQEGVTDDEAIQEEGTDPAQDTTEPSEGADQPEQAPQQPAQQ
ncbi:hypothetical protein [Mesorhizobium sp. 1M-11]|uniref:hypothetical protein n=1 Tax=Mesorhizobium sp. 1M-11 TaxID=1529006 RepID=UPI000A9AC2A9|nr:hypothetical protein [Mesorhizobium sp. 1M-11]